MNKVEFLTAVLIGIVSTVMLFPAPVSKQDYGKMIVGEWETNWPGVMMFNKDGTYHHAMTVYVSGIKPFTHHYRGFWKMGSDGVLHIDEAYDGQNFTKWSVELGETLSGKLVGQVEGSTRFFEMKRKK